MIKSGREQLVVWLLFVGRHLLDVSLADVAREGQRLTTVELAVLLCLRAFPSISQTELASLVARDKTTLSRTVSSLEGSGLLASRMDPVDGRRKALDLTDRARALLAPALDSITDRLERATSKMSPEEERACFLLIEMLMEDISVVKYN